MSRVHSRIRQLNRPDSTIPTLDFNPAHASFTPAMAKREGSVFAAAPIIQGSYFDDSIQPDVVSVSRGTQVSGYWYDVFDAYQGGGFTEWLPEQGADDTSGDHYFWYASADYYLKYDGANDRYELAVGGQSMTVDADITAGTMEILAWGFDTRNDLDGTNYAYLSRNDSQTFGISISPTASAPGATIYIGSNGSSGPLNGILEGLVFVREVPYNGAYGTDLGEGDIVNAHYNAGSGADVAETIGAWGTTLSFPTDASVGELSTGTGEAWSFKFRTGNVLTDAYMETTWASSAWSAKGTPSDGPKDIADSAEQMHGVGGYQFTVDADGEGIEQSLTSLSAGENYVLRLLAHEGDGSDIRVRVYDDTNSADITTFTFGSGSSKDAPGVALITWELPTSARNGAASDCTAMTVSVEGTVNGQTVWAHQCETLENLVDAPSFEVFPGDDPDIPDGWTNLNAMAAGDAEEENVTVHSGSASIQFNTGADNEGLEATITLDDDVFYSYGGFLYSDGGMQYLSSNYYTTASLQSDDTDYTLDSESAASWTHSCGVYRVVSGGGLKVRVVERSGATGDRFVDDIYAFALDPVSLTVTPQSLANSTEEYGISVTGRDTLTMPCGIITPTEGMIRWRMTFRHGADDFSIFRESGSGPYLMYLRYAGNDNRIYVYLSGDDVVLTVYSQGNGATSSWDASGTIAVGGTYDFAVRYDNAKAELLIDGIVRVTAEPNGGIELAGLPDDISFGSNYSGVHQADVYIQRP